MWLPRPAALQTAPLLCQLQVPKFRRNSRAAAPVQSSGEKRAESSLSAPSSSAAGQLALKEWAVTCAALGNGDQTVLLRKGGIREPTFRPAASRFLLLPTSFHSEAELLKPRASAEYAQELLREPKDEHRVRIDYIAEVTGKWATSDPGVLQALDNFHVWSPQYLETRLRFRSSQKVTIMELRCKRLPEPLMLPNTPELWGCFSWAQLPPEFEATDGLWSNAVPAIPCEDQWAERQHALRRALEGISVETLTD